MKSPKTTAMWQIVALSEISSKLTETSFFSTNTWNWTNTAENCFAPQIEAQTAIQRFSDVLKHIRWKLSKNSHFGLNREYLENYLRINWEGFFSLKPECNGSYPIKKMFELQNVPNWAVLSYSCVLYRFRLKLSKTTFMWQKVAISNMNSRIDGNEYFSSSM